MKKRMYLAVIAVVVVAGAVYYFMSHRGKEVVAIDLVQQFPQAEKRTGLISLHEGLDVIDVTINGETKHSIFAHPFSRIIWKVQIPPNAVLKTATALHPKVWGQPGDGAQFRIGISDGKTYDEFYRQMLMQSQESDHRWFPVEIDLSQYAGQKVEIIFNTDPGPSTNNMFDHAIWGEPRIVTH